MSSSLLDLPAGEWFDRLSSGDLTSEQATTACLDRISAVDDRIGAFLHVDAEGALKQARDIDARRKAGQPVGPLAGIPVSVKDVLVTRDQPTTCASKMLQGFRPPYDAHVVERLRAADAVIVGKTNMDEFAMGSSTENSAYKLTRNPWDLERAPGGSSGGSAACVSAAMTPLSVGTDTGGSIRLPASFCGIVGVKPTYGRVSRYGLVAYGSSLDQAGPFSTDVAGAARLLEAMSGHDRRDSTSVDRPVPPFSAEVHQPLSGLRIGVAREHFAAGLSPEVESIVRGALDVYKSMGATLVDISLPHSKYCVAVYYLVACSEASSNLARYDGVHYGHRADKFESMIDMYMTSRAEGFGAEIKRRIMLGTYALSSGYYDAYYLKALKVRRLVSEDFTAAFGQVDLIASPVAPTPAFKLGELVNDPLAMYLGDIYTIAANLAGIPGLSIPAGLTPSNLPVGLQLLAPPFEESRLLRAARMLEATLPATPCPL
jgi:aspartyl-tRNA(Asn)/glutamyl-tRNA(Gln) amidotransferase subunit A